MKTYVSEIWADHNSNLLLIQVLSYLQIEKEQLQRIQETRNRNQTRKNTGAQHENGQIIKKNLTIESNQSTQIQKRALNMNK